MKEDKGGGRKFSPRRLAYEALLRQQRGSYANLALKEVLAEAGGVADKKGRAFASALFYTALEHQLTLEYYFKSLSTGKRIALPIRCILLLGGAQLLYMEVPARAAIHESVALCKEVGKGGNAGFVNGILRELDRRKETLPAPAGSEGEKLSIRYSYPIWLVERLLSILGREGAERFMASEGPEGQGFPRGICVRANPGQIGTDALREAFREGDISFAPGRLMAEAQYLQDVGDITQLDLFQEGRIAVQGESSMLVGTVADAQRGMRVLDACAAPGGKTAYMAGAMGSGELLAWDIYAHRVELIERNCARLGLDWVKAEQQDAAEFRQELEGYFDLVLVDAPCSGLGVLEDKPDIKYAREPEELAALLPLQAAILSECSRYVRPGGSLVYSTCTILPEENTEQVQAFLQQNRDFCRGNLTGSLPEGIDFARAEGGELQLWPHIDGVAGFYVAKLERKREESAEKAGKDTGKGNG